MKRRLRWWLWSISDWLQILASSLLDDKPEAQDIETRWWEITAGVYTTLEEASRMVDDVIDVLCGGYEDGGHHLCSRDVVASVGLSRRVHSTSNADQTRIVFNWDSTLDVDA